MRIAIIGVGDVETAELLGGIIVVDPTNLNTRMNARGWPWRSGWKLLGPTG